MTDVQVPEIRFQLAIENIHCGAPETVILTDRGSVEIASLKDKSNTKHNFQWQFNPFIHFVVYLFALDVVHWLFSSSSPF